MRPVICMITTPARGDAAEALLVERVAAAARAGVNLIQIRDRAAEARPLTHLAARCVSAVAATRARVVVNDRADVALAAGAHGVHLRGDSPPAARVRSMAPRPLLIGRSVHGLEEAAAVTADGTLDYLIFGTVFPSASKPAASAAGAAALAAVAAATGLPVLAVGGVNASNAALVAAAGAAGFAAIGLFASVPVDSLGAAVGAAAFAFDTPSDVP